MASTLPLNRRERVKVTISRAYRAKQRIHVLEYTSEGYQWRTGCSKLITIKSRLQRPSTGKLKVDDYDNTSVKKEKDITWHLIQGHAKFSHPLSRPQLFCTSQPTGVDGIFLQLKSRKRKLTSTYCRSLKLRWHKTWVITTWRQNRLHPDKDLSSHFCSSDFPFVSVTPCPILYFLLPSYGATAQIGPWPPLLRFLNHTQLDMR
jgi:hypothetical protein